MTQHDSFLQRLSKWTASPMFWRIVLVLGLAVRCVQYFSRQSYWYDESYLVLTIRSRGFAMLLGAQPNGVVCPPIYLWVTRLFYDIAGQGELVMRLPGFIAAIAALFVMARLARRLGGAAYGVWALAFLAVSRHAILHGAEAHPYSSDLLIALMITGCTAVLVDSNASKRESKIAFAGLMALGLLGPWTSFPSVFMLGAASLAMACASLQRREKGRWMGWIVFNAVICISAAVVLRISNQQHYKGLDEFWGSAGEGGFPDWHSPLNILMWIISRPVNAGNYGTREMGIVLALLAVAGGFRLAKQSRPLLVLFVVPLLLAIVAALIGKYPLVGRTAFFLLPSLWLLAMYGIRVLVEWTRARGWECGALPLVFIAIDAAWAFVWLVHPEPNIDYRGAYQYINAHRQPADMVWPDIETVYDVYYGKDPQVIDNTQRYYTLDDVLEVTKGTRVWILIGAKQPALIQSLSSHGRKLEDLHHVAKADILLLGPQQAGQSH